MPTTRYAQLTEGLWKGWSKSYDQGKDIKRLRKRSKLRGLRNLTKLAQLGTGSKFRDPCYHGVISITFESHHIIQMSRSAYSIARLIASNLHRPPRVRMICTSGPSRSHENPLVGSFRSPSSGSDSLAGYPPSSHQTTSDTASTRRPTPKSQDPRCEACNRSSIW